MRGLKTTEEVIKELRAQVRAETQKAVAQRLGISETFLSDFLNQRRGLSDNLAIRLGYTKVVTWRKLPKSEMKWLTKINPQRSEEK